MIGHGVQCPVCKPQIEAQNDRTMVAFLPPAPLFSAAQAEPQQPPASEVYCGI